MSANITAFSSPQCADKQTKQIKKEILTAMQKHSFAKAHSHSSPHRDRNLNFKAYTSTFYHDHRYKSWKQRYFFTNQLHKFAHVCMCVCACVCVCVCVRERERERERESGVLPDSIERLFLNSKFR